ncbi:MAG: PA2778 family cysteine peptidase [Marinobacter sp.]|uniref:PA2778 family cysteine peptidase n=1 Tax=Marinobacter sp. TaxID=50741 RepID=UPI00299DC4E7|nr:PA2778 family cysteine peptidase [Marinobacter sp.]MDX1635472.1 PA2778 family cysteine peptidase [Marinobacter sp.]
MQFLRHSGAPGLGALLALILTGCASMPPWPGNTGSEQPVFLEEVPFYAQERYQCGPAALASMLNSQGRNTDPAELVDQVYLPERRGSLKVELVAAARRYGLIVYPLDGQLAAILAEVSAGHPVLVMQNLGFDWFPQWHFAVVVGFDARQQSLILHTDTREASNQPAALFQRTWSRADRWAAVMLPPTVLPATAEPLRYLTAASVLELTGNLEPASAAYRTALRTWPDQPAARLGLGNIAYQRGDWQMAAAHYAETVKRFPSLSAGWNNLAHALAKAGCSEAANRALACANKIGSKDFPDDLTPSQGRSVSACPAFTCPEIP